MNRRLLLFLIITIVTTIFTLLLLHLSLSLVFEDIKTPEQTLAAYSRSINILAQLIIEPYGIQIHAGLAAILAVLVVICGRNMLRDINGRTQDPPSQS